MKSVLLLLIFAAFFLTGCEENPEPVKENEGTFLSEMSEIKDTLYKRAMPGKKFVFPEDHGPHPGFKTEWWYFTGNLQTPEGREFGYQFTIFRSAVSPDTLPGTGWESRNIYMGHFTLTDAEENKFYYFEKFSRDGNNLAGAIAKPFAVWLEGWKVMETGSSTENEFPAVELMAKDEGIQLELFLNPVKPVVLQGDAGYSQKGPEKGNASYYYSVPRFAAEGKVVVNGKSYQVTGNSWLDREWSTSALGKDQQGWDWFSLHLSDNSELMFYSLRKSDGTPDIYSKGVYIIAEGKSELLKYSDVSIKITGTWVNKFGDTYPAAWEILIPKLQMSIAVTPKIADQELDVTVRYWEGAVSVKGQKEGKEITGDGYFELTGYSPSKAKQ